MSISQSTLNTHRKVFLRWANVFFVAGVGLFSIARADVTATVDEGQSTSQHKQTDPAMSNGKQKGGATSTDTITGSVFYTITVRNLSAGPAYGVTLEYHFFNKTLTTDSTAPSTVSLDDITSSSTFDLAPNAVKTIESSDIPKSINNSSTAANTSKKGVSTPSHSSSTITSVMGWVVYIKKGDRVVHTITSNDSILDDVARIRKANGG
jgi:hypothetical protein